MNIRDFMMFKTMLSFLKGLDFVSLINIKPGRSDVVFYKSI